ncbi:8738_t:CDS:1, partial [Cetraspora pellucida]
ADEFKPCNQHTPVISNVTISPNPPKPVSDFEIKGSVTISANIEDGDFFFFGIIDPLPENPSTVFEGPAVDICTKTKCPTKTFDFDEHYNLSSIPSFLAEFILEIVIGPSQGPPKACGL